MRVLHFALNQTVSPTSEPISLTDAKRQLRIDGTDDDAYLYSLITAARAYVETFTHRQLMSATYQMTFDCFPTVFSEFMRFYDIRLWDIIPEYNPLMIPLFRPPVQSIMSITYIDPTGTTQTMNPATDYIADLSSIVPRITPSVDGVWPDTQNRMNCVTITYVAGYSGGAPTFDGVPALNTIPGEIMAAMRILITELYVNRQIMVSGRAAENPLIKNLLYSQRVPLCL